VILESFPDIQQFKWKEMNDEQKKRPVLSGLFCPIMDVMETSASKARIFHFYFM